MLLLLFCAFLGFMFLGPAGLLLGLALGYVLLRSSQASQAALPGVRAQFLDSTFAVMGALCKADGVVTPAEIRATEQVFVQLGLSPEQTQAAKAAFQRGKAADFDLDAEVDRFVQASRGGGALYQLFLQVQLWAVAADGEVHEAERVMLLRVARRLGLHEIDLARLEALLRSEAAGAAGAAAPSTSSRERRLEDAYTALGVSPDATEAEIKRAYRKLISENHPDKLAAKGLPENMRQLAEKRAREINVAYDVIREARKFV